MAKGQKVPDHYTIEMMAGSIGVGKVVIEQAVDALGIEASKLSELIRVYPAWSFRPALVCNE